MKEILFRIHDAVIDRHPDVIVGGFRVDDLPLAQDAIAKLSISADTVRSDLESQGITLENLASEPRVAGWRNAVRACGLKPSTFKSSVEQLGRRFLRGESISVDVPLVCAYCAVSARHLAPMGGYDLDRLADSEIVLRMGCPGTDTFEPLGGRAEDMPILESVVVYGSGSQVICWLYNCRDSKRSCLSRATRAAVFFSEAVRTEQQDVVKAAMEELASLLKTSGGNVGSLAIASSKVPQITLTV